MNIAHMFTFFHLADSYVTAVWWVYISEEFKGAV